jgi:hypothetical protein
MPDIVVMFVLLGLLAGLMRSDLNAPKAAYIRSDQPVADAYHRSQGRHGTLPQS